MYIDEFHIFNFVKMNKFEFAIKIFFIKITIEIEIVLSIAKIIDNFHNFKSIFFVQRKNDVN